MTYEIRSFDANGAQSQVIPGAKTDVTDELFTSGMVKITAPRSSIGASRLSKRLEVALFLDGVEIDNTRAILTDHTGNPADGGDAAGVGDTVVYGGKTLFARLRDAVVYPSNWPKTIVPPYHDFNSSTPGVIVKTLLQRAQSRGALLWVDHAGWSSTRDASGAVWSKTVSLRFTAGTDYASILENMVRLGAVEFRMQGRRLSLFNPDGVGRDLTTGGNPVVLRRGRDVIDTPYSESTDELSNVLLVLGDAGGEGSPPIMFERSDADSIALFGRVESSLSQGSTKDLGTLGTLADASLDRTSREKGEYSTKFTPDTEGPRPHRDFQTGDWVFLDKSGELERYRVRQLSITTDDEGYQAVATLNDRFTELDLRTAKKVEGIIGGASAETVQPAKPDMTDYTVPSAPTGLGVGTNLYTDPVTGQRLGNAVSNWLPPATNTDGSALDDLASYEIEHQTDGQVVWDVPTSLAPFRPAPDLASRFDRRGKTKPGWVGADGGGNWQADSGEVFHCWGDTLWGTLSSDGKRNANMPRNTMTSFLPSQAYELSSYAGTMNLIDVDAARGDVTTGWTVAAGTLGVASWAAALGGRCVEATSSGAGEVVVSTSLTRKTSQGNTYKPVRAGKQYRLMWTFDSLPVASAAVTVTWLTDSGATVSTSQVSVTSSSLVVDEMLRAPTGAVNALVAARFTATASGQKMRFTRPGVFETDHRMASWRLPARTVTVTNEIANPDGAAGSGMTVSRRNYSTNPAFFNDLSGVSAAGGANVVRDTQFVHGAADGVAALDVVNAGALGTWKTALSRRGITQANVVVTGTSVSSGQSSSTITNRYLTRLQDMLRDALKVDGVKSGRSGYQGVQGFVPGWYQAAGFPSLPGPGGQGAGGTQSSSNGLGGQALHLDPGHFKRFTARFTNLRVLLVDDKSTGGTLEVTVDGQTWQTSTKVTSASAAPRFWDCPVTFSSADHVVEIRNVDPSGAWSTVMVGGLEFLDGDRGKGVHVYDGAHSGWAAQDNVTNPNLAKSVAAVKPHLVTIELGYNDAGRGRTSAQYKADLQTTMAQIRSACSAAGVAAPSFLLVGGYDPGSAQYGNAQNPAGSWPEPWPNYLSAMRSLATGDVAFVDLSTVMPKISDDKTGLYDGSIHPSDKGHALIAKLLYPVLNDSAYANKRASVRVTPAASTSSSGAQFASDSASNWANGDAWTYSAWVKAPTGARLQVSSTASPATTSPATITGTGGWQRVSITGTFAGTPTAGPSLAIRTPDTSQGAVTFYVGDVMLETGAAATAYFDGETPAGREVYAWAGARYASASMAGLAKPNGWTSDGTIGTVAGRFNATGVRCSGGTYATAPTVATMSAGPVTGVAWVKSATGGQARLDVKAGSSTTLQGLTVSLQPGEWTEVRVEGTASAAPTGLATVVTGAASWDVSEVTLVGREWSGGSFSGSSKNGESIACAWTGAANASRSTAAWLNSNYVDVGYVFFGQVQGADQAMQLFDTSGLPGGHVGEWAWAADGAYTTGNKAVVVYETVMSDASVSSGWNFSFNGSFWIAEFDLAAKKMLRARRLARDPRGGKQCISWGAAVFTDMGFTYVYGNRTSGGVAQNYVVRAAVGNAYAGPYEVWTSSGWKAAPAGADLGRLEVDGALPTPASIGATPDAGISSVRKFRGKFKAFALGGWQKKLAVWTADNPQGPWSKEVDGYAFPDPSLMYYSAKWQPGTDDNSKGYSALFCQSSGDSILNPGLYIPAWVRGAAGPIVAGAGGTTWKDRQEIDGPPAAYGRLKPGSVYSSRVRAVDQSGNHSEWAVSPPVIVQADLDGPNKPSTPVAYPQFQGARVIWDGMDEAGVSMPGDFAYYTVHMSESETFLPAPQNVVDKVTTAGGVSSIQDLPYGKTFWFCIVAVDTLGNESLPSDVVSVSPERLSDPDLPDKLITGAKIADGAISVEKLTVSSFGENLIPGGNMEEARADGTVVGWRGYFTDDPKKDTESPIAGSGSLRVDVGESPQVVRTDQAIPITPGETYYVAVKLRTSRPLDAPSAGVYLAVADTAEKAGSGFGQDVSLEAGRSIGGSSMVSLEKGVEVPWRDELRFGRIVIRGESEATPYTLWVDDVEVRKITGEAAIADASIGNAKIKNLAVDDAKIANLSVGKVTAGRIYADWIQSGRLLTPPGANGSWSLMDSLGFHVFRDAAGTQKSFDTTDGNTWMSGILEASEIRGGQAWFPSQYANVPGHVAINEQGLAVDAVPTVNLCPNPSFEKSTGIGVSDGTSTWLGGAAVQDYAGNIETVAVHGKQALVVSNTTKAGSVDVPVGKVNPNTTYTVSWHSAATRIDGGTSGASGVYGDYSTMGVVVDSTKQRLATGRTGYLLREGALQGVWNEPLSSGIALIGYAGGWVLRTFLTFTTPASLAAGTRIALRLPTPRTQSNGNETTLAVAYDGLQLEQQPWMTRFCDGDMPSCVWDGERNNSTSRRNMIRSAWLPTQDEPVFNGNVRAPEIATRQLKVGTGVQHGSNAVETLMGNDWSLWNGGGFGWFGQINWDNTVYPNDGRYMSDDGAIFPPAGGGVSKFFKAVTGGMYAVSATITFPSPQQEGRMGLRLRHLGPGGKGDGDGSILASTFLGTHENSQILTVTWTGWSPPGWRFYFEAYQNTQSGDATMPKHSANTPCRASVVQFT